MRALIGLAIATSIVAACATSVPPPRTPPRALGPGEAWVPVELWEPINGVAVACGGVGYEGEFRLHGSPTDARLVWMTFPDASRHELAWPLGYSARFTPGLELLDEQGQVVGREGSRIVGGCETPKQGVMWVDLEPLQTPGN